MFRPLILLFMMFAFSCENVHMGNSASSLKQDSIKTIPSEVSLSSTAPANKPASSHYKFDSSQSIRYNILHGWMDTFAINGRTFRLRLDSADAEDEILTMEYYQNNNWVKNTNLSYYSWDFGFGDINRDGYPDFSVAHKLGSSVNFFNPKENLFDTTTWEITGITNQLDSTRNMNYTWWADDATPVISKLYSFKGIAPYYYYILFYQHGKTEDINDENRFVGLWKCRNGLENIDSAYLIKKINLAENEDENDFECEKFWKANYTKLVNQYTPGTPNKYYANYKVVYRR